MKEFDYDLDYKNLDFSQDINRKYYRIGRGEQGVLLVEPYKSDICKYWKFLENLNKKKNLKNIRIFPLENITNS